MQSLDAGYIRAILSYDPETGIFTWLPMGGDSETARRWNGKTAGNIAGTVGKRGYRAIGVAGEIFQAHRLAWLHVYGEWPGNHIDHIDRNPDNNAIANLRVASQSENSANRSLPSNNKSGAKGVHWNKKVGKWRAGIRVKRKMIHLGHFESVVDAALAYEAAAKEHFGQFGTGATRA
ncbi:MAG: HNH endonuclease signature motif containing protein [Pseudomonadota bacterium]